MPIKFDPFWKGGRKLLTGIWQTVNRWGLVSTIVLTLGVVDLLRVLILKVQNPTIAASCLIFYVLLRSSREPQMQWMKLLWLNLGNFAVGFELCHRSLHSTE